MAFPKLKKFAAQRGWEIVEGSAYGDENGYLITLIDGPGFKSFAIPLAQINEENKALVLQYLGNSKKRLKISSYSFEQNVLLVTFKESFASVRIDVMNRYVDQITAYLSMLNIKSKGYCTFCGNSGADQTIYIDGVIYSAHDQCYNNELNIIEDDSREFDYEEKNYLIGFVGAIFGGIVTSIPWIIVQTFLDRVVAVLAIVIGMGAIKGYYLLKGKLGPMTRWIVAFATMVAVVLAQFISLVIEMLINDIPIGYQNFIIVLNIPEVLSSFKTNLIMSLFIALLGISGLFLNLKGDSRSVMPTMSKR